MDLKKKLDIYLNEHLESNEINRKIKFSRMKEYSIAEEMTYAGNNINNYIINNKDENTFQTKLFNYIDSKGLKDSDVYNKVDIDRRLFSKIRSNKDYHPSKETIILLGLALEISEEEIEDLLKSASYSLPMNTTFDLIIRFCFKEKIYNINTVNNYLFDYNCKLLTRR